MFALPGFLLVDELDPGAGRDLAEVGTWIVTDRRPGPQLLRRRPVRPARSRRTARVGRRRERRREDRAADRPEGRQRASGRRGSATMKAVILAGGEGTRLRPLTSNQPKPMMPLVNQPMMEHIVHAARARTASTTSSSRSRSSANQIRNYFGDGSDFGVADALRDRGVAARHRGSVRNASAELDDTFLVISGDVLTDIDLDRVRQGAPRRAARPRRSRSKRVENPLEFGIVITRARRQRSSASSRSRRGARSSPTRSTPASTCSSPRSSTSSPRARSSTSPATCSPRCSTRACTLHGHVADGYWEDVGTTEAYLRAHADVLDGRVEVEIAGFELGEGVWLGEGAEVDPDARGRGPGRHRRQLPDRGRRAARRVHGARHRRRREGRRVPRARGLPRPRLRRPQRCACAAAIDRPVHRPARRTRGSRRASSSATSASSASTPSSTRACKIYPFKTVEAERGRQLVDRVGEPRRAHAVRSPRHPRARQRRHHPGGRGAARDGVRHRARSGARSSPRAATRAASARALKRAVIGGLNLAGVNVEDIELATVPLTRFQVRNGRVARRHHGAARARRSRQRRDPLLRRRRARHRRGDAAQDRAAALPRGLPPRVRRRHRRHRVPAAVARVLHRRARARASTPSGSASARSRSCSTTRSARRRS